MEDWISNDSTTVGANNAKITWENMVQEGKEVDDSPSEDYNTVDDEEISNERIYEFHVAEGAKNTNRQCAQTGATR